MLDSSRFRSSALRRLSMLCGLVLAALPGLANAQNFPGSARLFAPTGFQDAVAREVLRTISQLPPVTNVGYSYVYDPALDTFVSQQNDLGSGMVPTARFNRKGSFSAIVSFAYFELEDFDGKSSATVVVSERKDRFANVDCGDPANAPQCQIIGIASSLKTQVYVTRLAARYTILDRLDVGLALPLVVADTSSFYLAQTLDAGQVGNFVRQGTRTPPVGGNTLLAVPVNRIDPNDFANFGSGGFNEGTNFDVGNLVLDTKLGFDTGRDDVGLGIQVELRLPTASEEHFSGTETTGLRGMVMANYQSEVLGFYVSGGYEQDFDTEVLSNGVLAASLVARVLPRLNVEVGMNANFYRKGIDVFDSGGFGSVAPGTVVIAGDPVLGTEEVNFGGGVRFNPVERLALSAYATIPANDDGYRADNIVAVSLDYPF